jgi:hypothetical protein
LVVAAPVRAQKAAPTKAGKASVAASARASQKKPAGRKRSRA